MRNEFAQSLLKARAVDPAIVFITGDLGYLAFEEMQRTFGPHFINAGVAEQNMVSMAAAMAHEGFRTWVYSISPFVTLRPYEQIRNDICLHSLPVKLVGNGGGYGYGIMGATHHNLEDIGAMRLLPNMRVYVPFTAADVEGAVGMMRQDSAPNYLRLNIGAKIDDAVGPFSQWRRLRKGSRATVIGTGPVLENICNMPGSEDLEIWLVGIFPIAPLPALLIQSVNQTGRLITIEEHAPQCSMAETMALHLMNQLSVPVRILPLTASGYPSGRYGDQGFHQSEVGLRGKLLHEQVERFLSQPAHSRLANVT